MSPGGQIEKYDVPQNPSQAAVRRDTIAKSLYERLFDLIVSRINVALDPRNVQTNDQVVNYSIVRYMCVINRRNRF